MSVVVRVDAELDESLMFGISSTYDMWQTKDGIVSRWREVFADEKHHLHDGDNEILHPLGYETSLLVIRHAKGLALYFICMTLSALMSLRDQWCSRQLRDIVQSLFTFLSCAGDRRTFNVKRLIWPLIDYKRCLDFFSSVQG